MSFYHNHNVTWFLNVDGATEFQAAILALL